MPSNDRRHFLRAAVTGAAGLAAGSALSAQMPAGAQSPVTVFGGVQNVTNRKNFAGYTWDRRNNVSKTSEQLGIFPILGLEWQF